MRQSRVDAIVDRILEQPSVPSRHKGCVSDDWVWVAALGWAAALALGFLWSLKVWG